MIPMHTQDQEHLTSCYTAADGNVLSYILIVTCLLICYAPDAYRVPTVCRILCSLSQRQDCLGGVLWIAPLPWVVVLGSVGESVGSTCAGRWLGFGEGAACG